MMNRTTLTIFVLAGLCAAVGRADDWPQWMGPRRNGVSAESAWRSDFGSHKPPTLWGAKVGRGYAAVTVVGDRALTVGNADNRDTIWCFNADNGQVRWTYHYECPGAGAGFPGPAVQPTVDGDRLYTVSRLGHLICLRLDDGAKVWSLGPEQVGWSNKPRTWHGATCHPLIVEDRLILQTGHDDGAIAAFDKQTGRILWRAAPAKLGYASPILRQVNGQPRILAFTGEGLIALSPTGEEIWRHPMRIAYQGAIAPPTACPQGVFVASLYHRAGVMVKTSQAQPQVLWQTKALRTHTTPNVYHDGHIYGFDGYIGKNRGKLLCLDANTGRVRWQRDDLGVGSLMVADDRLIILTERGELLIGPAGQRAFAATTQAKVTGGKCWTMPVLANGRLYCRNAEGRLICLDLSSR
jgi:outer membrane protein assembly factor BamB